jgi:hypothetical protein
MNDKKEEIEIFSIIVNNFECPHRYLVSDKYWCGHMDIEKDPPTECNKEICSIKFIRDD